MLFIFISYFTALTRTSSAMLNRRCETKIYLPCFSSWGKAFSLSPSKKTLVLHMSCVCVCVCICVCVCVCVCVCACSVAQSYPTLCDPLDCNPPGSSVYGIFQARKPKCAAISSFRVPHRCPISRWSSPLFQDCRAYQEGMLKWLNAFSTSIKIYIWFYFFILLV